VVYYGNITSRRTGTTRTCIPPNGNKTITNKHFPHLAGD
jgi:hypothetical protein